MNAGWVARSSAPVAAKMGAGQPSLTLSVDFSQRWGVRSKVGPRAHAVDESMLRASDLVHRMLVALDRADVAATWFVPAALSCGSWDEYFATAPDDPRRLSDSLRISTLHRDLDPTGRLHFAPAAIEELAATRRHEIATSGFSGLSAGLFGVGAHDAVAEVAAACSQLERATGRPVRSVSFPDDDSRFLTEVAAGTGVRHFRIGRRPAPRPFTRPAASTLIDLGLVEFGDDPHVSDRHALASPIDHSVRFAVSSMRWDVELRTLAHRCAHVSAGRNVHIRWSLQQGVGHDLDVDVATSRFVEVLGAMRAGCERSGATIVALDRLSPRPQTVGPR